MTHHSRLIRQARLWSRVALPVVLVGCGPAEQPRLSIEYEKYVLENGLNVVLHVDRSDPLAAVAMTFHVGSAREREGKTGFAHLFEHLFFLDSENLGPGGLDRLMTRVGSAANGFTSNDQTTYFEVVPKDALEKALWAESDKLGFFISTVTPSVLAKEKQVVKNEKRQSVDNQPYGHEDDVLDKALYPSGHPYSWQVIGSLEDLESATLDDVHEFHRRWYGPNNATLVVAGDIDIEATKQWIGKYFGEIPPIELAEPAAPVQADLTGIRRLVHEDNFASLPQLTLAWPSVPLYHPDAYALDLLAPLLTEGKTTPFYKVVVEEEKLAPAVDASNQSAELAGRFVLQTRAFAGKNLNDVYAAIERAFARFETDGVAPEDLERAKARYEAAFYRGLSSAIGKAFQLAQYNMFAGSPGYLREDLDRALGVTESDIERVYAAYLKDRPHVVTSFVPKAEPQLALTGSERAQVVEEQIVQGAEAEFVVGTRGEIPRTPSSFDRSKEPPFGESPSLKAPTVWGDTLANGLRVLGIEDREIPLVRFELRLKGGLLLDDKSRVGVANLLAETMTEGTATKTPEQLEQAIELLGSSIEVNAGREEFVFSGSTLARNFGKTMALLEEILVEPRWDAEQFDLARDRVAQDLRQRSASPFAVAQDVFTRVLYGDHILAVNPRGSLASIDAIQIPDLKRYYQRAITPTAAAFHVSGAVSRDEVLRSLRGIADRWESRAVTFPDPPGSSAGHAGLYFVDIPGAKQSVLQIGYLALAETDPEFYPAVVMNFRLGGGGFASDLTQVLREQKGYTYGIGSQFQGTDIPGPFTIFSPVRSNVTYESLALITNLMTRHGPEFDAEDLNATKSFLLRSNALAFETLGDKLGILADMSAYGFPADYVLQREAVVRDMTIERIRELAARYLDPSRMVWLVVGDARSQLRRLRPLGLGAATVLPRP